MTNEVIRVLVVEDNKADYLLTRRLLRENERTQFEVSWASSYDAARDELRSPYDVCLVDYRLGAHTGLELIERAVADGFSGPMILLTGHDDHETDVEAMKAGAADYLVKGQITSQLVGRVIRHSIERRTTEGALRRSEEELRQSQKMEAVGSLAAGVAHDFNNLLSIILSYSELLVMDLKPGDPMRADLEEITSAGTRAAGLTRQLLAYSRRQVLQPRIVDLNDICSEMEKMLRRLLGEDVEFETLGSPTLGKIKVDPGQMEQVIMNLAVNARDAMPRGGILTIETSNAVCIAGDVDCSMHGIPPGEYVKLTLSDTGTGMTEEVRARMFDPFFTTKEVGKGTGLGLSTVFGIVKQSGGSIWADSEPGEGTTLKVCFPLAGPAEVLNDSVRPSGPYERQTLRGDETVLVVEDDERLRIIVCATLRRYGYEVLQAGSGGDALIVAEQHGSKIDLLLSDVVMPLMRGPELAARLTSVRPDMKVMFMSGYMNVSPPQQVTAVSADGYFQKPITPRALARMVRQVLHGPGAVSVSSSDHLKAAGKLT